MCARSSGRARRSAMRPTGRSTSGTSRATARATCSSTSIRSGPIQRSISSGSTTTCRCRTGATASSISDAAEGWPAIYDRAYLQGNIAGGEGFDWFYASAADRVGAGPHPDHRWRGGQAVGLPLQGSARLVVEPALRPSRRGGERHADRVGAAVQADLVHRARLSRPSTGAPTSRTSSSTRSRRRASRRISRGAGATTRSSAPISRRRISGGARPRTTRCPRSTAAGWCMCPNAPPGPGTRGPIRSSRR